MTRSVAAIAAAVAFTSVVPLLNAAEHAQALCADEIRGLIQDLAGDAVRWNAHRALEELKALGAAATAELERDLDSPDWQQRQLCAHLLRGIEGHIPTPRLLEVTVEGLRDDQLPYEEDEVTGRQTACTWVFNAKQGTLYLLTQAKAAEPFLKAGLDSADQQQRFLCAFVLGTAGLTNSVAKAAPVLIVHLRDNDIPGDALMSASALFRFGPAVMPELLQALESDDLQQAQLARLIILDLTDPPETRQELQQRKALHDATNLYYDPVIQYRHASLDIMWHDSVSHEALSGNGAGEQ